MSTRSIIAGECSDGKIRAVYVHYDGYGLRPTLEADYNTQEKVDALLALGDQSSLGEPYGDESSKATILDGFVELDHLDWGQEYIYKWDGTWSVSNVTVAEPSLPVKESGLAKKFFDFADGRERLEHGKTYYDLDDGDKYEFACTWLEEVKGLGAMDDPLVMATGNNIVNWLNVNRSAVLKGV